LDAQTQLRCHHVVVANVARIALYCRSSGCHAIDICPSWGLGCLVRILARKSSILARHGQGITIRSGPILCQEHGALLEVLSTAQYTCCICCKRTLRTTEKAVVLSLLHGGEPNEQWHYYFWKRTEQLAIVLQGTGPPNPFPRTHAPSHPTPSLPLHRRHKHYHQPPRPPPQTAVQPHWNKNERVKGQQRLYVLFNWILFNMLS